MFLITSGDILTFGSLFHIVFIALHQAAVGFIESSRSLCFSQEDLRLKRAEPENADAGCWQNDAIYPHLL